MRIDTPHLSAFVSPYVLWPRDVPRRAQTPPNGSRRIGPAPAKDGIYCADGPNGPTPNLQGTGSIFDSKTPVSRDARGPVSPPGNHPPWRRATRLTLGTGLKPHDIIPVSADGRSMVIDIPPDGPGAGAAMGPRA